MRANTRASLWRAAPTVDDRGDEVDAPLTDATAVFLRQPAAITEKSRSVFSEESQRWETVRAAVGRFYPRWSAQKGDRVRDDLTGQLYSVQETKVERTLSGRTELVLDLRTL